jgi:hypothetical protein
MKNRSGWAFGDHGTHDGGPSAYLTILGSAYTAPELYGTREEAEEALGRHPLRNSPHMNMTVAHVTETPHGGVTGRGYAYPITGAFDAEDS